MIHQYGSKSSTAIFRKNILEQVDVKINGDIHNTVLGTKVTMLRNIKQLASLKFVFTGWNLIKECAYNTSAYPRPSIFKYPYCFDQYTTWEINDAMASVGDYHKYKIDKKLRWDDKESCIRISRCPICVFGCQKR
jgi:hypothetical protein